MLDSINTALSVDADARRSKVTEDDLNDRLSTLTEREKEVLDHLLAGRTGKEIAGALAISPRTAEAHWRNLLHQLGVGFGNDLIRMSAPAGEEK